MARLAAAPVLVTCMIDDRPWGLTVSACCSVSVEPPLLLISVGSQTATARAIAADGRFGVHLLGEQMIDVARFGSAVGQAKFCDHFCDRDDPRGLPLVQNALAQFKCTVNRQIEAGDHTIFLGAVQKVVTSPVTDRPLLYFDRSYHRLAPSTDLGVAPAYTEAVDSLLYPYPIPRDFNCRSEAHETVVLTGQY
jgi:flavin reductase ActVB